MTPANRRVLSHRVCAAIQFAQNRSPAPLSNVLQTPIGRLDIGPSAGEPDDFDHGASRRLLGWTVSQDTPCEGSCRYSFHRWSSNCSCSGLTATSSRALNRVSEAAPIFQSVNGPESMGSTRTENLLREDAPFLLWKLIKGFQQFLSVASHLATGIGQSYARAP